MTAAVSPGSLGRWKAGAVRMPWPFLCLRARLCSLVGRRRLLKGSKAFGTAGARGREGLGEVGAGRRASRFQGTLSSCLAYNGLHPKGIHGAPRGMTVLLFTM